MWHRQKALLKLGIPMGLSYLIEVTSYTFMALFISHFGTTTLAGHQIAGNLGAVLYMTPLSIGVASSTLVSQALGAQRFDAARLARAPRHRVVVRYRVRVRHGVFVLQAAHLDGLHAERCGDRRGDAALAIVVFYHFFDALQITTAFVLRAYKVTLVPTVIYAVALWGIGLGGGYLLGFDVGGSAPPWLQGARGFWVANTVSLGVAGVGLFLYWRRISTRHIPAIAKPRGAEPELASNRNNRALDASVCNAVAR